MWKSFSVVIAWFWHPFGGVCSFGLRMDLNLDCLPIFLHSCSVWLWVDFFVCLDLALFWRSMVFLPSYSSSVRYQWWSSTWGSIRKKFQAMEPRWKIGTPWSFYKFIVSDFKNLERVVLSNQKVQGPLRRASLTLFDHLQLRVCLLVLLKTRTGT